MTDTCEHCQRPIYLMFRPRTGEKLVHRGTHVAECAGGETTATRGISYADAIAAGHASEVAIWERYMRDGHGVQAVGGLVAALYEHRDGKDIDIAGRAIELAFETVDAPDGWREKAITTVRAILETLPTPVQGEG